MGEGWSCHHVPFLAKDGCVAVTVWESEAKCCHCLSLLKTCWLTSLCSWWPVATLGSSRILSVTLSHNSATRNISFQLCDPWHRGWDFGTSLWKGGQLGACQLASHGVFLTNVGSETNAGGGTTFWPNSGGMHQATHYQSRNKDTADIY